MHSNIIDSINQTKLGVDAENILKKCVHCGFCLATCPTYNLLGEEINSPRGRIYLIKNLLETGKSSKIVRKSLDQCLSCRSCETTCPSGVEYHHLLDIGQTWLNQNHPRNLFQKSIRYGIRKFLGTPVIFNSAINVANIFRPILAKKIKRQLPSLNKIKLQKPETPITDKVLLLTTCVQPSLSPNINNATINVLNKLGIHTKTTTQKQCCGAIDQHLGANESALNQIKNNIDSWIELLKDQGCSHLISNASGCGAMIQDYAYLLSDDPEYAEKAKFISDKHIDIAEYLSNKDLSIFKKNDNKNISLQIPCSLQHGQKTTGTIEKILGALDYKLPTVNNSHLCCGSAGTYSIFNPKIANKLLANKLDNLTVNNPEIIVSANIGCISHLQSATTIKVIHWIELL